MGYYSEIATVMSHETYLKGLEFMKNKNAMDENNLLKDYDKIYMFPNGDILIHFDSVKWYASFEDVKLFNDYIRTLEYEDYKFIEVGEDGYTQFDGEYDESEIDIVHYIDIPDKKLAKKYSPDNMYICVNITFNDDVKFRRSLYE